MKELSNVEVIICDCKNYGEAICAIRETLKQIKPAKVTFFTDIDLEVEGVEVVKIKPIRSRREYSEWMMKELWRYLTAEFVLTIQSDGFVLSSEAWSDKFLDYDVIGSPWNFDSERLVGNLGFGLTSKRLREVVGKDDFIDVLHPEDQSLCVVYRYYLEEKYGIKFAPVEVAEKFGFELREPTQKVFGFHGTHWEPFREHIMITRRDSLGDVIACQPILEYYHNKGYRVFLNTLPQFQGLFMQHYFRIYFPHELNPKVKFREVNLNMSYESFPKMNHLDAYYQACGVPVEDRIMKNPVLTLDFDPKMPGNKLFDKYVTIHADIRAQGGRNIYGLDWDVIADYLIKQGYTVLQVGRGESPDIKGAIRMNTPTEPYLMWVLGGADMMIAIDSGLANISVAMNVPSVIFTGSVDLRLIYPDLSNILWINNNEKNRCNTPMCWHQNPGTQGQKCYIDESKPPCAIFDTYDTISKIDQFIKERVYGDKF